MERYHTNPLRAERYPASKALTPLVPRCPSPKQLGEGRTRASVRVAGRVARAAAPEVASTTARRRGPPPAPPFPQHRSRRYRGERALGAGDCSGSCESGIIHAYMNVRNFVPLSARRWTTRSMRMNALVMNPAGIAGATVLQEFLPFNGAARDCLFRACATGNDGHAAVVSAGAAGPNCTRSHRVPYRSRKTATVPYGSEAGGRTNSTPAVVIAA